MSKHSHYFKSVEHLTEIDVYRVCDLFKVDDPSGATQHAIKKLLLPGQRGAGKTLQKDLQEAADSITRRIRMLNEDAGVRNEKAEPVIDLDALDWSRIKAAADSSPWMPAEYCRDNWVSDVIRFLSEPRDPLQLEMWAVGKFDVFGNFTGARGAGNTDWALAMQLWQELDLLARQKVRPEQGAEEVLNSTTGELVRASGPSPTDVGLAQRIELENGIGPPVLECCCGETEKAWQLCPTHGLGEEPV